jgi:hypothetical protein
MAAGRRSPLKKTFIQNKLTKIQAGGDSIQ